MNVQSDEPLEEDPRVPVHGMTVLVTAVFVVGEIAGTGILALPKAINDTGWVGIAMMIMVAVVSTYTGALLGRCWMIVRHRHAQFLQQEVRQPYPTIGQLAFGKHCRRFVCFCVDFTCFGGVVVFLLLVSQNIHELLSEVGVHLSFCLWLVIITAALCPFCWLGTPKDFWQIGLTAALATAIACLMILTQILLTAPDIPPAFHGPIEPKGLFAAFGTIAFAFGGHQSFPTFQVDMLRPEKFGRALAIAYFTILIIYLPVVIPAFMVYGDNIDPNILLNITPGPLLIVAQVLITLHLLAGIVIVINPVCQEGEELLSIPPYYSWKRVVFRTVVMGLVLFTALTIPKFGSILSLIGGSTLTFMGFIFPPLFYLRLCSMKGDWDHVEVPLHEKVACVEIILGGALAGGAATYSAVMDLFFDSNMSKPCYIS